VTRIRTLIANAASVAVAKHHSRFRGEYSNFEAALRACKDEGYENSRILSIVAERTRILSLGVGNRMSPNADDARLILFGAIEAASREKNLSVIDFGGACGAHFYIAKKLFSLPLSTRWCVVETETMAHAGRTIATASELSFATNLDNAMRAVGMPSLIYTNNAVQYSPEPLRTVDQLIDSATNTVCISKIALAKVDRVLYTCQESRLHDNGPGPVPEGIEDATVAYPFGILPRNEVLDRIRASGELQIHYVHPVQLFHPSCGLIEYHSFVLNRRSAEQEKDWI
jgi:putative methyltransferase (TIGR04325 family)